MQISVTAYQLKSAGVDDDDGRRGIEVRGILLQIEYQSCRRTRQE